MAKKRKVPRTFEQPQATKTAKFDVEERFDDSEDDFFAGRDKVLLDENADTKRRRWAAEQEKYLQPSDEEILAYNEGATSEEEDEAEDENDEDDDRSIEVPRTRRKEAQKQDLEEEESEEEGWGTNRADYYGVDVIETEEQAKEEEDEARRLHLKQLKSMTEADFGFDESEWADATTDVKQGRSVVEKLPEAQIPDGATPSELQKLLSSRYPEFVPLAEEYMHLQTVKKAFDDLAIQMTKTIEQGAVLGNGLPVSIKAATLSTYLATISMYFAVVSASVSREPASRKITSILPQDLQQHPVIQSLARARQLWDQVEVLPTQHEIAAPITQKAPPGQESTHFENSVRSGVSTVQHNKVSKTRVPLQEISSQRSKSMTAGTRDQPEDATVKQKKERKPKNKDKEKKKLLDLDALMSQAQVEAESDESELGDEQPLTEEQYAEKTKKRKSLRFYTSQLAYKANKRGQASRVAGGDDDLPYKERERDKRDRLQREAEARGRQKPDVADDFGADNDYEDMPAQKDTNDDYYDTLLNANRTKKADKSARAEAYARAAKEGATVYEEETVGTDGKRAITYAIAKNKGLMPKRSKDVRNPRVKKKKKYEEKMKKLGSVRQVYKGGEGRGGYGGELTGIKTNVVKSVKL